MELVRRELHSIAEVAYLENETRKYILGYLAKLGVEAELYHSGVVATIRPSIHSSSSLAIGFRAELDGLPMTELSRKEYKCQRGAMHACGHDGHMTILLSLAKFLVDNPGSFWRTVHLFFTPAEEEGAGTEHLLQKGLLEKFPVNEVHALHNWPDLEVGQMACHSSTVMAGDSEFTVTITGSGGHAALPETFVNPLESLPKVLDILDVIRNKHQGVMTYTTIRGGTAINVVPELVTLSGTIRYFHTDDIESTSISLLDLEKIGGRSKVKVSITDAYPPTVNASSLVDRARNAILQIGCQRVDLPPSTATEDFSYLLQRVPGTYVWLGCRDEHHKAPLHNPHYDFNDDIIEIGRDYFLNILRSES